MGRGALQPGALVLVLVAACTGQITGGGGGGDDDDGGDVVGDGSAGDDGGDGVGDGGDDGGGPVVPPGIGDEPAVTRGGDFLGTPERFNRYYTDPDWEPLATIYVSPSGGGDGSSAGSPTTLEAAAGMVEPGTRVDLAAGTYDQTCIELDSSQSGTYEQPIVFAGTRLEDGSLTARINCCGDGRASCFN